jgi:Flp pilus assembly protein TadG
MSSIRNDKGSVLVFITLMIVLLMIMVGMGLDTGQLTYSRSMGQSAVDASALAAVSALPSRNAGQVVARATGYNSTNNYIGSSGNAITGANVSYVQYDFNSGTLTYGADINAANGVRVALEQSNNTGITTPVFLTPLLNLLGFSTSGTKQVNVSAVSIIKSKPAIPIALWLDVCPANDGVTTTTIDIKMQHPDQKTGNENSCWTTFLDCSSGAPDIKAGFEIAETCSGGAINGQLEINTPICQNRGQVNTVLGSADDFFSANGMPTKKWIVPVIGGGGNCDPQNPTPIQTWATIRPITVVKTGDPKYITAEVVCGPNLIHDVEASLCFSHRLIREPAKGY